MAGRFHGPRRALFKSPATATAAWTPASLTSLKGWYKADGTLLNGSSNPAANNDLLTQWNDESGNGKHLLADNFGANRTGKYLSAGLNGKQGVAFLESNTGIMAAASFALGGTKGSCYVYGKITSSATAFRYVVGYAAPSQGVAGTNGCAWAQLNSPNTTVFANQGGILSSGTVPNDTGTRFGSIFDGTNNTFVVNGSAGTPVANGVSFTTAGRFVVAGDPDVPESADCVLSEIIVTQSDLSGGELALLDTYLTRWN
jgi:hypothetical protein